VKRVEGYGPHDARLMIVGEAPGREEEAFGRPFVGKTGQMVRNILTKLNCHPDSVYWTNVVKVRPPDNEIKRLKEFGYQIADFESELWSEINTIKPNCILAFGNTALTALTGMEGIEKYRGSILQSCYASNKVVATIHPASLMHKESDAKMQDWKMLVVIEWDIKRAINQSKFPDLRLPDRNLIVCKSNLDLYRFLNRNSGSKTVSVDIETFRTIPICISFAFNSFEAISVPLFNNLGSHENDALMTRSDLLQCWKDVAELLANPKIQKIGQNFKFDEKQLMLAVNDTLPIGLLTRGFYFDTMLSISNFIP
jgi:uracil-DNA glycosylase family 4